ncbi:MAG: dTDP-4-dehydrorhamnose reductase [Actinomycetota bacterium]
MARVGNEYTDQTERTGHDRRPEDLDRFAALGLRALRYPVLWEREPQWEWVDERLGRLRELGVRPIVGLVHHGGGPPDTSLLDPQLPEKLAAYARRVAERYPWVEDWTPVNEPLTTARFSCLYGFWYPHRRDALSLAQALLNQVRAVVLSMRAIREVVPGARLIQTDDLGKTHSTPLLGYQAEHENERRWSTWDLLCGRWRGIEDWFRYIGIEEPELSWFEENPCPPDVVGVNHYLSSERFLDHRLERYPERLHGGNGRDRYVDELAARVLGAGPDGPAPLLLEAWERYRLPVAVTEAHNGCTREEQLRWLDEVWRAALAARAAGADVRAVTVWSLLGAAGWSSLLTAGDDYEPGVFDVRGPQPRPTALAQMTRALATDGTYDHPVLHAPAWWRRPERLWYPPEGPVAPAPRASAPPLLLTGAAGTLGRAFARLCDLRGLPYVPLTRAELDVADAADAHAALAGVRPWAVVNAAGYVRVDEAEREPERCRRENVEGPSVLARECAARGVPLVTFSSDLVFDGAKALPYVESDEGAPLSAYGASKHDGERAVLEEHPSALVVRTSAFFGPWDEWNFAHAALRELEAGRPFAAADDLVVSPTYVPDLVNAALDLLIDGECGLWHLANGGATTWASFARMAADAAGLDGAGVEGVPAATLGLVARRPSYSALGSERGALLGSLEAAVARFAGERAARDGPTFSHTRSGGMRVGWTIEKQKVGSGAAAAPVHLDARPWG